MKEYRILFTGVGRRVELMQAFRGAALGLGVKLVIIGADMAGTAPALAWCDRTERVCSMKDPDYIPQLLEICRREEVGLVIPTIDTDLQKLADARERFEAAGTKVLISDPDKVRICRDKNYTSRFFAECGLKAPMPVNDWRAYEGGYPAFIKPKDGSSSVDAYRVADGNALRLYAEKIGDYIIQPFIDGTEYTIDIFCDYGGEAVHIVPRERCAVRAGEVLKTKICMDPRMIAEAKALTGKFRPRGPITVQLIREKGTGEDFFIEINPRYGGGAPLSMKAGARSPESVLRMLAGEKLTQQPAGEITDGAVYSRFDQSVSIPAGKPRIRGVIFDLDDTLYPEAEYVASGYRAAAAYLGKAEYAGRLEEYRRAGKPAIDELLRETGREAEKEACLAAYRGHTPEIRLYPGMKELLKSLRARGIRTGILTDGRPEGQEAKIAALGLRDLTDDILITDSLGGPVFRKPCDIGFRILQRKWGIPFEELIYIGDNREKDFQAPWQLGMHSMLVKNPEGLYYREGEAPALCGFCAEGPAAVREALEAILG